MAYVGVGRRAAAQLIDWLIGALWVVPIIVIGHGYTSGTVVGPNGQTMHNVNVSFTNPVALLAAATWLAYMIWFEARSGATPGKRAVGIKVVKADGSPVDLGAAVARNLLRIVDGFLFYLLAAILVWVMPLNQRLGDLAAGTVVVRTSAPALPQGPLGSNPTSATAWSNSIPPPPVPVQPTVPPPPLP